MPKLNKNKKNLLLCAIFIFAPTVSSCNDSNKPEIINPIDTTKPPEPCLCPEDYENLWEQPLHIIRHCVLGEWKVLRWAARNYNNSFVRITKDSVIFTFNEPDIAPESYHHPVKFNYRWKFRNDGAWGNGRGTYVMMYDDSLNFNPLRALGWEFNRIQNDTLYCGLFFTGQFSGSPPSGFWFLRVRKGE